LSTILSKYTGTIQKYKETFTMKQSQITQGFTLIELMVVILIIGLLLAYIGPKVFSSADKAKITTSRLQLNTLTQALKQYRLDNDQYPSAEQGLNSLIEKPSIEPVPRNWSLNGYLEKTKLPLDAWGRSYQYLNPGTKGEIDVYSYGPDKDVDDDDIGNWQ